jgi:hypothetical protein
MSGPEDWYLSAEARWRHLPASEERDRKVQATFLEIRDEAEMVAVRLPELDNTEKSELVDEAVLDAFHRFGCPTTDAADELFDVHVERIYYRLCIKAREAKAEPRVRASLEWRRFMRMPGIREWLGMMPDGTAIGA